MVDAAMESPMQDINVDTAYIVIRNKIDLLNEEPSVVERDGIKIISVSAKENRGIDLLKEYIKVCIGFTATTEGIFSARQRDNIDALEKS